MRLKLLGAVLLGQVVLSGPAGATGAILDTITMHDSARLANHTAARDAAVAEARRDGAAADIAVMDSLLFADRLSFDGLDLSGDWRCRTTKVGGLASLVVYSWFRCRVTDDGSGWMLRKLTGSQRTTGRFFTDGDSRLVYLGSGTVNDDAPRPYGSGPESDQAGHAFRTGRDRWHIEFPSPYYESGLDILEFRR